MDYPKSGAPWSDGKFYLVKKNSDLQNQDVYYITMGSVKALEVPIDPNPLSEDGTVAVTGVTLSEDCQYTAYSLARDGSDWQEFFVRNMNTGEGLSDHITP
jgi:prolyl oligopeptidase